MGESDEEESAAQVATGPFASRIQDGDWLHTASTRFSNRGVGDIRMWVNLEMTRASVEE